MRRAEKIEKEVEQIAETQGLPAEGVQVFDLSKIKPQEHNWKHYGLMHICRSSTHPSHVSMSSV